ncbi:sensor histidine kinase [Mangrovactinospora gilvigrisea]|uniref:Sensor histidine kinase n=1 Tax=Mangrovactinospora gilvigrisea TaxID=1428644 RepID=A0A1J7BC55_9ACTN|nr:DUF5931 domain-containing protein [Mangrovactinospora gilvigrisea]OIV36251.1 sensor histidine kinase [Mangrovactinospora gilvigrisea]
MISGSVAVERPLWWALGVYRVLAVAYAVFRFAYDADNYRHPVGGWLYLAVVIVWTLVTLIPFRTAEARRRWGWWLLGTDLVLGTGGVLLTVPLAEPAAVHAGMATLPTVWSASPVLGFAIKGGWRFGAGAALVVGVANLLERGAIVENNLHNAVLLLLAGIAIGYVVTLARVGERALTRALRIEATTRERERLARDIHDGVLQVLALVQRRGLEAGGEAAELGRLAGEQEAALRALISAEAADAAHSAEEADPGSPAAEADAAAEVASRARTAGSWVTVSTPAEAVPMPRRSAEELGAAVGAALDNVRRHAGAEARAWVLVEEDLRDDGRVEVVVSVRDDGPGIPAGRLEEAEGEGRLGVAQSIRGRVRGIGGSVDLVSVPGQGAEWEFRVPRGAR